MAPEKPARTPSFPYQQTKRLPSPPPDFPSPMPGRGKKIMSLTITIRKIVIVLVVLLWLGVIHSVFFSHKLRNGLHRPSYLTSSTTYNTTLLPNAAFQPPEAVPYRYPDTIDTFASYKYRKTCNISSLDLHAPFAPLCQSRQEMLTAMSSGGRIGHDSPYMPRGCDMRWFSTEEVCEILGRFEKVVIVGDSMMRHVIGSINVLARKDLGYGAVTDWNFSAEERKECFCNYQFNVKTCSVQGIFKTADVLKNDPDSFTCPSGTVDLMIEQMIRWPIEEVELARFRDLLPRKKPSRPYAFIYGHGLWNDLDLQATLNWLDLILNTTITTAPWLDPAYRALEQEPLPSSAAAAAAAMSSPPEGVASTKAPAKRGLKGSKAFWPRLILTPNAAGREKPDEWIVSQGNKALMGFEESIKQEAGRRGVEHLGTWNMSIQSNKFDGVHVDLKGNLIKGMMVLNWLNMIEVEDF